MKSGAAIFVNRRIFSFSFFWHCESDLLHMRPDLLNWVEHARLGRLYQIMETCVDQGFDLLVGMSIMTVIDKTRLLRQAILQIRRHEFDELCSGGERL